MKLEVEYYRELTKHELPIRPDTKKLFLTITDDEKNNQLFGAEILECDHVFIQFKLDKKEGVKK